MANKANNRHSDNYWLEQLSSAVSVDASGNGTVNTGNAGTPSGATAGANSTRVSGVYKVTPATRTDGQQSDLVTDQNERLIITAGTLTAGEDLANNVQGVFPRPVAGGAYAPNNFNSVTASGITTTIKTGAGAILSFSATNANAAIRYLQFFDTTAALVSGTTVPSRKYLLPAGSATVPYVLYVSDQYLVSEIYFLTGITWAISTTPYVYTSGATAADHLVDINFV